jgi:hypothetical protein
MKINYIKKDLEGSSKQPKKKNLKIKKKIKLKKIK